MGLRRVVVLLTVVALMAVMMVATAMPAMANSSKDGNHGPPSLAGEFKAGQGSIVVPEEEIEHMVAEIEAELRGRRRHKVSSERLGGDGAGAAAGAGYGLVSEVCFGLSPVRRRGAVSLGSVEAQGAFNKSLA